MKSTEALERHLELRLCVAVLAAFRELETAGNMCLGEGEGVDIVSIAASWPMSTEI